MAREIKFRAFHQTWDMRYFTKPEDFKWFFGGTDGPETTLTECELMQYTGLKDKNGKEIYEGDVLGRWEDEQYIVFGKVAYGDAPNCLITGQYYLADEKGFISDWGLEDDAMPSNWHNLEVVGNALEHPKLLKEATNG